MDEKSNPLFVKCLCLEDNINYWHWKYQYEFTDNAYGRVPNLGIELYHWCIENIDTTMGWHIFSNGIIFYEEEDAMAFKLRWM